MLTPASVKSCLVAKQQQNAMPFGFMTQWKEFRLFNTHLTFGSLPSGSRLVKKSANLCPNAFHKGTEQDEKTTSSVWFSVKASGEEEGSEGRVERVGLERPRGNATAQSALCLPHRRCVFRPAFGSQSHHSSSVPLLIAKGVYELRI